jgi:multisubunit Na+/H+ antiporter MnhB subunit
MGRRSGLLPMLKAALVLALAAVLVLVVLGLPAQGEGLTRAAAQNLDRSGVEHPVTAVLLNFRGYDTWLEVGVLLLAALGLLALQQAHDLRFAPSLRSDNIVLVWLARLIAPVAVVVGGYLLWLGTHAPGGAFQAGAVLAAALVLLRLAGYRWVEALPAGTLRGLLLAGFGAFLAVAVGTALSGRYILEYPAEAAGVLILGVELGVTLATAFTLAALFAGAAPRSPAAASPVEPEGTASAPEEQSPVPGHRS